MGSPRVAAKGLSIVLKLFVCLGIYQCELHRVSQEKVRIKNQSEIKQIRSFYYCIVEFSRGMWKFESEKYDFLFVILKTEVTSSNLTKEKKHTHKTHETKVCKKKSKKLTKAYEKRRKSWK